MTLQNSIYAPTPFDVTKGGTGNDMPWTNGQLLIGNTGNEPSVNTLTAGDGIGVTNNPGGITITNTSPRTSGLTDIGFTPSPPVNLVANYTYLVNTFGPINFILPQFPTLGDTYTIVAAGQFDVTVFDVNLLYSISYGGNSGKKITPTIGPTYSSASITLICRYINPSFLQIGFTALSTNSAAFTIT